MEMHKQDHALHQKMMVLVIFVSGGMVKPAVDKLCLLVPVLALLILDEAERIKSIVAWQILIQTWSWVISREPAV